MKIKLLFLILFTSLMSANCILAQEVIKPATRNTWLVSGMTNMNFIFKHDKGEEQEDNTFVLNFSERVLWFPISGLGVGLESDIYYFKSNFSDFNIGIGPHIAYYLNNSERLSRLMLYIGGSYQYVNYNINPGSDEHGWRLKVGLGLSPIISKHLTIPIEIGYINEQMEYTNVVGSYNKSSNRIYLEIGFGAFLWKKK